MMGRSVMDYLSMYLEIYAMGPRFQKILTVWDVKDVG